MGLPVHWKTIITYYQPPECFVDEQLRGPYAFWHHTHKFTPIDEGTMIEDTVKYAIPFGIFGRLAHFFFVRRQLKRIFEFRARAISKITEETS